MKVLGFVQWVNPIPQQPFVLRYSQTSVLKFVQHLYPIRGSMCALLVGGREWVPCLTEVGGPPTNQSVLFSFSQYGYPTGGRTSWRWDRYSYVPHIEVSDGIATYESVALR